MPNDLFKKNHIEVDTMTEKSKKQFFFFQGDKGTAYLVVTLLENGQPLNLTNRKIRVAFRKPDNNNIFQDEQTGVTVLDAATGKFEVELSTQVLSTVGVVRGQVAVSENEGDNKIVAESANFSFIVNESLSNSAVVSSNELPVVDKVIESAEILGDVDLQTIVNNTNNVNAIKTEIENAQTDEKGVKANNLKERINGGFTEVAAQLAQTEQQKADKSNLTYINVKNPPPPLKGAKGDGITDDTQALQTILNSYNNVYFPSGDYLVKNTLNITSNASLLGHNARLISHTLNARILLATGTLKSVNTSVTSDINIYDNQISLTNTTGIEVGDILQIKSNILWYFDNRGELFKGETFEVGHVDHTNKKLTLNIDSSDGYSLQNETIQVMVIKPIKVEIEGISFINGNVGLNQNKDSVIRNCLIDNPNGTTGVSVNNSVRMTVEKTTIKNCFNTSTGYGLQDNASTNTKVLNCHFSNNRRGIDFSGGTPSRFGTVRGCSVEANGYNNSGTHIFTYSSGFGTHGTAEHITFENNQLQNVREGFVIRGKSCIVQNNKLRGKVSFGVSFSAGEDLIVDGNTYESLRFFKTTTSGDLTRFSSMGMFVTCTIENVINNLTITNNKADVLRTTLLNIHANIVNLNLFGNQLFLNSNASSNKTSLVNGLSGRQITITRLFNKNNNIRVGVGTYTEIENVTVTNNVQ